MSQKNPLRFLEKVAAKTLKKGPTGTEYITFEFTSFGAILTYLDISSGAPIIKKYRYLEINPEATENEQKNAYLDFIQSLGVDKKRLKAMISIYEGMVFRQLSFPEMPQEDLMKAILWDLKKKFYYNPDENHLGFVEVMTSEGDEIPQKLYNLYYCEKKLVQSKIGFVQSLGIEVESLIPSQAALAAFAYQFERMPNQDALICEMTDSSIRLLVARENRSMLSRKAVLASTGDSVTDEHMTKIADEIKRTIDFYESQKFSRAVGRVFFAGGGFDTARMHEFMSKALSVKVEPVVMDPYLSTLLSKEDKEFILGHPGLFSNAIGLPLVVEETINLVPDEIKSVNRVRYLNRWLNLALIGLAVILIFITGFASLKINLVNQEIKNLKKQHDNINSYRQVFVDTLAKARVRRTARKGMIPIHSLFKELSIRTPALAVIRSMQFNRQDGSLIITGEIVDAKKDSSKTVNQFVTNLAESPFIQSATITSSSADDENKLLHFEIGCVIKGFS